MTPAEIKIRDSINKAFLRLKPARPVIEGFKSSLITLLDQINSKESEEFHKNLVISFLEEVHFAGSQFISARGRTDLVVHAGKEASTPVGVILEVKKPTNKAEMISKENLNAKAFQELIDFGDLPVFEEATTYPVILILTKVSSEQDFSGCMIKTLVFQTTL